jgi:hypothetical protein
MKSAKDAIVSNKNKKINNVVEIIMINICRVKIILHLQPVKKWELNIHNKF